MSAIAAELLDQIARECVTRPYDGKREWDDWRLLARGDLCNAAFAVLANEVRTAVKDHDNVWLAPANLDDGPYACMGLQAHLPWPVTGPMRSKYGVFLHPDPFAGFIAGRQAKPPRFVLVDTVFNTGSHAKAAASLIATVAGSVPVVKQPKVELGDGASLEPNSVVVCVAVIYNNLGRKRATLVRGAGAVPVVCLVRGEDPGIGGPLPIANQQVIQAMRLMSLARQVPD